MAAEDRKKKIVAVDIVTATTIGSPLGGSTDAKAGDVVIVGNDITEDDAGFLVASGIALSCAPALKVEREKKAIEAAKKAEKEAAQV